MPSILVVFLGQAIVGRGAPSRSSPPGASDRDHLPGRLGGTLGREELVYRLVHNVSAVPHEVILADLAARAAEEEAGSIRGQELGWREVMAAALRATWAPIALTHSLKP
jgi:hypothetical protein